MQGASLSGALEFRLLPYYSVLMFAIGQQAESRNCLIELTNYAEMLPKTSPLYSLSNFEHFTLSTTVVREISGVVTEHVLPFRMGIVLCTQYLWLRS